MRKCTSDIVRAFVNGKRLKRKNTETDGESIFLHGHRIAWKRNGAVYATLAGWGTPTTRERLNGLARVLTGRSVFHQKNYVQYFNDVAIGERQIIQLA